MIDDRPASHTSKKDHSHIYQCCVVLVRMDWRGSRAAKKEGAGGGKNVTCPTYVPKKMLHIKIHKGYMSSELKFSTSRKRGGRRTVTADGRTDGGGEGGRRG